jgi:DNA-binding NarL/FixJ family response regulator
MMLIDIAQKPNEEGMTEQKKTVKIEIEIPENYYELLKALVRVKKWTDEDVAEEIAEIVKAGLESIVSSNFPNKVIQAISDAYKLELWVPAESASQ